MLARSLDTLQALARRGAAPDGRPVLNWPGFRNTAQQGARPLLAQDCHGAPGVVVRLAGAPHTPTWNALLEAAAELVWQAGPLVKGPGLCHGTAGNGFALLKLWRRSGDAMWLARARVFAMHAVAQVEAAAQRYGQGRHSLWTGDPGVALYLWRCLHADDRFPTLDHVDAAQR